MIWSYVEFSIVLLGFFCAAILFRRFPHLPKPPAEHFSEQPPVSVIIPARNEEKNLPLLLSDLKAQIVQPLEILCADDASEDGTAKAAADYGATVLSLRNKPDGWIGKSWACQQGAEAASGKTLLFLDADVRLAPDAIRRLLAVSENGTRTVSAQPFHTPVKVYEQLSMLFNLIQIAANGSALAKPLDLGLFGPIILIPRSVYQKIGGHQSVRRSIVEDMAMGGRLRRAEIPYHLYLGGETASFRMYRDGLASLLQGWIKNIASGAARMPFLLFLAVFLWITSLTAAPLHLIRSAFSGNLAWLSVYALLYAAWTVVLAILARQAGRFRPWIFVFYPVPLILTIGVFTVSLVKKIFGLKVTWKGRGIVPEEKSCD